MWPISIEKAKRLQIEITTFCNAACPSCERANYKVGTIYKRHLNSIHVSLKQLQKWLPLEEMKSMEVFHLCGNIDEPTLNPEIFEICEWLEQYARVHISTNGGTKNKEFWKKLATLKNTSVIFGIDGLSIDCIIAIHLTNICLANSVVLGTVVVDGLLALLHESDAIIVASGRGGFVHGMG